MAEYYVNRQAQANGDHEVHRSDCTYLPGESDRLYLGTFPNCFCAVREVKKFYVKFNGCYYCSPECHTT